MTEKEVFHKFMTWMGMVVDSTTKKGNETIIVYDDTWCCDKRFSKEGGDDSFYSAIVVDDDGNILKGYFDSSVSHASVKCEEINKQIN